MLVVIRIVVGGQECFDITQVSTRSDIDVASFHFLYYCFISSIAIVCSMMFPSLQNPLLIQVGTVVENGKGLGSRGILFLPRHRYKTESHRSLLGILKIRWWMECSESVWNAISFIIWGVLLFLRIIDCFPLEIVVL